MRRTLFQLEIICCFVSTESRGGRTERHQTTNYLCTLVEWMPLLTIPLKCGGCTQAREIFRMGGICGEQGQERNPKESRTRRQLGQNMF